MKTLKHWEALYGHGFAGSHFTLMLTFDDGTTKYETIHADEKQSALTMMKDKIKEMYPGRENDEREMKWDGTL